MKLDVPKALALGLAIRAFRHQRNMSAKVLSQKTGIATSALNKIETGRQGLRLVDAFSIAAALDITLGDLYEEGNDQFSTARELHARRLEIAELLKRSLKRQ